MSTYELCLKMAAKGKLKAEQLDVFFAAGRLTKEQYEELIEMIRGMAREA